MALYNNLPPPKDAGQEQITNINKNKQDLNQVNSLQTKQSFIPVSLKFKNAVQTKTAPIIPIDLQMNNRTDINNTPKIYNHFEYLSDEYNPLEPNEYESSKLQIKQEIDEAKYKRLLERQLEEDKRQREKEKEKQVEEMERMKSSKQIGLGRGRGLNMVVPAWMAKNENVSEKPSAEASNYTSLDAIVQDTPNNSDFCTTPSNILLIRNLPFKDNLRANLRPILERFGQVKKISVYKTKYTSDKNECRVFVQFLNVNDSTMAATSLHKIIFEESHFLCCFYDETRFARLDFETKL